MSKLVRTPQGGACGRDWTLDDHWDTASAATLSRTRSELAHVQS